MNSDTIIDTHIPVCTAVNSDYATVNSLGITFVSGQSSTSMAVQCVDLTVVNDAILEGDETFNIQLFNQSSQVRITFARDQAQVVIMEDNVDCK